jgi:hypothetical protein
MEQRTVIVSKIRITKSDLLSICENERGFFIQAGDLLNDLNVFSKLLMFCMNRQRANNGAMKTARDVQTMCLIRILVGKLHEGWKLIEKWYYGSAVSKKYDRLLEQSAKDAVGEIKKYFSRTNLISEIRNSLAFHYGPKEQEEWRERVRVLIEKMRDSQILEIYVSKAHGNCLFPISNELVILDILNLTGESNNKQAWEKLHEDIKKVINWFIDFLNDYHLVCAEQYLDLKASDEEEIPAPSIKKVSLPYFTTD